MTKIKHQGNYSVFTHFPMVHSQCLRGSFIPAVTSSVVDTFQLGICKILSFIVIELGGTLSLPGVRTPVVFKEGIRCLINGAGCGFGLIKVG